jgi:hypothetical protein
MICLSWPVGIELGVLLVIIAIPFFFLVREIHDSGFALAGDVLGVAAGILFLIFYYWMLHKYVNIVAHSQVIENLKL